MTFTGQGCISLIKIDSKNVYNVTKEISISNKYCSFELHQNILKENALRFPQTLSSTTLFNIDNNKKCFLSSKSSY